jgi:hypothetical protein
MTAKPQGTSAPQALSGDPLAECVATLKKAVSFNHCAPHPDSHCGVSVKGIESADAVGAFGLYCASLIGSLIDLNLQILKDAPKLWLNLTPQAQLSSEIDVLLGKDNNIDAHFRDYERNPWFMEAIGHLLCSLDKASPSVVPGEVQAATFIHGNAKDKGLDLVAVFRDSNDLSVAIGESKASFEYAGNQLGKAVDLFGEIDSGPGRGVEIRNTLLLLSRAVDSQYYDGLVRGVWFANRAYMPIIGCGKPSKFECCGSRKGMAGLQPVKDRKILVVIELDDFYGFFDRVADAARSAVPKVAR